MNKFKRTVKQIFYRLLMFKVVCYTSANLNRVKAIYDLLLGLLAETANG